MRTPPLLLHRPPLIHPCPLFSGAGSWDLPIFPRLRVFMTQRFKRSDFKVSRTSRGRQVGESLGLLQKQGSIPNSAIQLNKTLVQYFQKSKNYCQKGTGGTKCQKKFLTIFFLVMRTFQTYSFNSFQIGEAVLLTAITVYLTAL